MTAETKASQNKRPRGTTQIDLALVGLVENVFNAMP
jgi:hypothetical protein